MWEYYFVYLSEWKNLVGSEARANELGKKGWELICVDNGIAYFKRSRKEDDTLMMFNVSSTKRVVG